MQGPAFAATSREDTGHGAAWTTAAATLPRARLHVCSDLRAHDNHGCAPLEGFLRDDCRSRPRPPFENEPVHVTDRHGWCDRASEERRLFLSPAAITMPMSGPLSPNRRRSAPAKIFRASSRLASYADSLGRAEARAG
jgi:hypothetical protein